MLVLPNVGESHRLRLIICQTGREVKEFVLQASVFCSLPMTITQTSLWKALLQNAVTSVVVFLCMLMQILLLCCHAAPNMPF